MSSYNAVCYPSFHVYEVEVHVYEVEVAKIHLHILPTASH